MRFYTTQHQYYCGIDLHARSMFLCIMDRAGEILLHRNYRAEPTVLLKAITPYRRDLVVAVEERSFILSTGNETICQR